MKKIAFRFIVFSLWLLERLRLCPLKLRLLIFFFKLTAFVCLWHLLKACQLTLELISTYLILTEDGHFGFVSGSSLKDISYLKSRSSYRTIFAMRCTLLLPTSEL